MRQSAGRGPWGGLRGGISVALALTLEPDCFVAFTPPLGLPMGRAVPSL
jgi:hypothetical protein